MKSIVLRRAVWNNNVSKINIDGNCNQCGEIIYYESFICWSKNEFDEINVDNFLAICKRCECSNRKIKQPIPKLLRSKVWRLAFESHIKGNCYICDEIIDYDNFHCGHIISEYNGGLTECKNLRPVCAVCNKSCSIYNMDDLKKMITSSNNQ